MNQGMNGWEHEDNTEKEKIYLGLVVCWTSGHGHKIETVTELRCLKLCKSSWRLVNTYIRINFSLSLFLAYMTWFPDKVKDLSIEVVMVLCIITVLGCFFIKANTSLCVTKPSGETENDLIAIKLFVSYHILKKKVSD